MATALVSHQPILSPTLAPHHLLSIAAPLSHWIPPAMLILIAMTAHMAPKELPRTLQVKEEQPGQLLISWGPGQNARLDINDGGSMTTWSVSHDLGSLTYAWRREDVTIQLTSLDGNSQQVSRLITSPSRIRIGSLYEQINELIRDTQQLRVRARDNLDKLDGMQTSANLLLARTSWMARPGQMMNLNGTRSRRREYTRTVTFWR